MAPNVCNKNAVAERTLIDKFLVSEAMVHFTFLLLLAAVARSTCVAMLISKKKRRLIVSFYLSYTRKRLIPEG